MLAHLLELAGGVADQGRGAVRLGERWSASRDASPESDGRLVVSKTLLVLRNCAVDRAPGTIRWPSPVDIHQLRSWIFELYEPLENERQYIVYDAHAATSSSTFRRSARAPAGSSKELAVRRYWSPRTPRPARKRHRSSARRSASASPYTRTTLPRSEASPTWCSRTTSCCGPMRARSACEFTARGPPVVLLRKAGGVLVCGDLDLASDAAHELMKLEFSAVLSSGRSPMWNAGKDTLLQLQRELPKPRKLFSILVPPPWDRAYTGRLENLMAHNEKIVPREATAPREAAMGTSTLVVARQSRDLIDRAKRPMPSVPAAAAGNGGGAPPPPRKRRSDRSRSPRTGTHPARNGHRRRSRTRPSTSCPKRVPTSRARSVRNSRVCRSRTSSVRRTSTGASARSISRRRATRSRSAGTRPATSRSTARPLRRRRSIS